MDTGRTAVRLTAALAAAGAASVRLATLLDKPARRVVDYLPDYTGFQAREHNHAPGMRPAHRHSLLRTSQAHASALPCMLLCCSICHQCIFQVSTWPWSGPALVENVHGHACASQMALSAENASFSQRWL